MTVRYLTEDEEYEFAVEGKSAAIKKITGMDGFDLFRVYSSGELMGPICLGLGELVELAEIATEAAEAALDDIEEEDPEEDAFTLAADYILQSFVWQDTEEGFEFYDGLENALRVASLRMQESSWELPEGALETGAGDPCGHAAEVLYQAFAWYKTNEGDIFWREIYEILKDLSLGALPTYPYRGPTVDFDEQPDVPEDPEEWLPLEDPDVVTVRDRFGNPVELHVGPLL